MTLKNLVRVSIVLIFFAASMSSAMNRPVTLKCIDGEIKLRREQVLDSSKLIALLRDKKETQLEIAKGTVEDIFMLLAKGRKNPDYDPTKDLANFSSTQLYSVFKGIDYLGVDKLLTPSVAAWVKGIIDKPQQIKECPLSEHLNNLCIAQLPKEKRGALISGY